MKKVISILLSLAMLLSITAGIDFSALALDDSGSCGENVEYSFDYSTGTLTISGTGKMKNYFEEFSMDPCSSSPFYNSSINYVVIKDGVTSIGDGAFYGCSGLTSITIPDSVTGIGKGAFYKCTGLTSITIPDSVASIDDAAFGACTGLTSITIPYSVTNIGSEIFYECSGLESITVDDENEYYDSRNDCNAIICKKDIFKTDEWGEKYVSREKNTLIAACQNTIIPEDVTCIAYGAFAGCTGLTSITIPDSVTSIDSCAFFGCTGLTSITIPDSVTSIGVYAFKN